MMLDTSSTTNWVSSVVSSAILSSFLHSAFSQAIFWDNKYGLTSILIFQYIRNQISFLNRGYIF